MAIAVEAHNFDIPLTEEARRILDRSEQVAGRRRVTIPHIASALVEAGRQIPGDPFYGLPETVAKRLKREGDLMVRDEPRHVAAPWMPKTKMIPELARRVAAQRDSEVVTPWHLSYAIAQDEIETFGDGNLFSTAGIEPEELSARFNGETDRIDRFGSIPKISR